MTEKKYKTRKGSSITDEEAQIVGETIDDLRDSDGHVTSRKIVKEAKSKKSSLHDYFEWDDDEASDKFRLQQARKLVESIVEVVIVAGENVPQRSFFSVYVPDKGRVYVTLKDAMDKEDYRKQLLDKAITSLENLTRTMKMFREYDYPQK